MPSDNENKQLLSDVNSIFSFRAECEHDVNELIKLANGLLNIRQKKSDPPLPDLEVELESTLSLRKLRDLMKTVTDGHVMVQTLRQVPLSDNNLERNYAL